MNSNNNENKESYVNIIKEIKELNDKIKDIYMLMNKKEDDLKNIINEKNITINEMNKKILIQEDLINKNKEEIINLNNKINKINNELKEKDNKIIVMGNSLSNIEKEMNKSIDNINLLKTISIYNTNFPSFNLFDSSSRKNLDILTILKIIQERATTLPQQKKEFYFDFSYFINILLEKNCLNDITLIIKYLSDTAESFSQMEESNPEKDLYYQINLLNNLFKDISLVKNQISGPSMLRQLNDKELLQIDPIKLPLSRLYLCKELLKDEHIFSCKIKSYILNKDLYEFTNCIIELYNTHNINSFQKMLSILKINPYLFSVINLIFPYKHFSKTKINNITYIIDLITFLYLSKINFIIVIDKNSFLFQTNKNKFKMICTLVLNKNFLLDINTKIERILVKGEKPKIIFKFIPQLVKDINEDYILWNYYIYLSILDIINNKKEELIDENEIKK